MCQEAAWGFISVSRCLFHSKRPAWPAFFSNSRVSLARLLVVNYPPLRKLTA
jgi:hypothetical protein